ncbi:hypothetical protein GCM10011507_32380 [Edaphobacter acidisoli]|uniref:SPOR domain-containing protein n=1 Tax=Edaphobacter acidisoli TaxID=2040573 RepID=A0A916S039_9BACT|nr:SPOR domain-containing protein [Edaphobacter acidisoli]GGA78678.1 hypothetical protein GCM10011507_32380 [Edaphobacter acidisoli]
MELWSEYEGRTIDGVFPLTKLLQPEGRSAFFATPNGTGKPTVIRLIESHFDDDRIVSRWREVAALDHPNLVKLKKFGKVEMDGAPLVYGVMEPADGNLGEIVSVRRLTVEETREVAESLVGALKALHDNGFVHEHIDPGSVLAVGEKIKLRSDCIRETPEGDEGVAIKRRDVRDLAAVLLRSLTQRRTLEEAKSELPLAAPFDGIVRNGLNGSWGLREIAAALAPAASPQIAAGTVVPAAATAPVAAVAASAATPAVVNKLGGEPKSEFRNKPEIEFEDEPEVAAMPSSRTAALLADEEDVSSRSGMGWKALVGVGVVVVALFVWGMFHGHSAEQSVAVVHPAAVDAAVTQQSAPVPADLKPSAATGVDGVASSAASTAGQAAGDRVEWRAIAFTYNHEDQAKTKAERLASRHPELKPEVFTPNGRAPYLVSIGGAMSREDAYALARKARSERVAGDVYAQNFHMAGPSE